MRKYIYSIGICIGLFILGIMCCFALFGCSGIDNDGTKRTAMDIKEDKFVYLDNEAIALAESANDTGLRAEALEAYNEVNEIRVEEGLDELSWDKNLETVANVRAKECSQNFSHTRPNGSQWYTVNSKIQGGENLAYGFDNAKDCVDAWMASPTHRDNILYDDFEKVAISIYEENGVYYWAQAYGY